MTKSSVVLVCAALMSGATVAAAQGQPQQGPAQPTPQATEPTTQQAPTSAPNDANLGGPGESCRARSDCKSGLKCMNQICTDEHEGESCGATSDCGGRLKCIQNKCTSPLEATRGGGGGSSSSGGGMGDWMKFNATDGNAHPFVGLTLAGGFATGGFTGNGFLNGGFDTFDGTFLFALQGGVFLGHHQLSFEIAPVTWVYDMKSSPGPAFEMNASYAYFVPLTDSGDVHVSWPLRIGLGMAAAPGNNLGGLAFFQARADVIGAAFQIGHVMIDLHLPTFRYFVTDSGGTQLHMLDWLFGTSLSYVF